MYKAIKEKFKIINQKEVANIVGITESTMSIIVNGKQTTNKTTAYCIVKAIHSEAEINEYFTKER